MRVFYRALPGHPVHGPEVVYEQAGIPAFCCEEIRRHWGTMIGFGARNALRSTDREVNLWTRIEQARGLFTWGLIPVNHCPFCGEPVEVCRTK